jgi:hypothetical protein
MSGNDLARTGANGKRMGSSPPRATVLIGRDSELAFLAQSLEETVAGRGRVVLVGGEPGIGKTTLVQTFTERAANTRVLWGRCWEGEGAPAFWPWIEIIRAHYESHREETLAMMGPGVADIAPLVPELKSTSRRSTSLSDPSDAQARFRTFDSISRFLVRAGADEGLAIVIDDLHAADDASILLLEFLSRFIESSKVLVVATYRDLAVGSRPQLAGLLESSVAGAGRLKLSGLVDDGVEALLSVRLGETPPQEFVRRVKQATDGNPFLVGEIVRTVQARTAMSRLDPSAIDAFRIPDRVATLVQRHVGKLPRQTVEALSAAAVIGREFSVALVADILATDQATVARDLEPAFVEGILRASAPTLGNAMFSHALISETLTQLLPSARRLALHRSIAERLERGLRSDTAKGDPRVFQIAHHYFSAAAQEGSAKALEWAERAAAEARQVYSYELAAQHYQRALQVLDLMTLDHKHRCRILLALANSQALAGQPPAALATFEQVEKIARDHGNGEYLAKALLGCSDTLRDGAVLHPSLAHRLEEALSFLPEGDSVLRSRVLAAVSMAGLVKADMANRLGPYCDEAVAMARRLGEPETLAIALHAANWRMMGSDDPPDTAVQTATEMIAVARRANYDERMLDGLLWRAYYSLRQGRSADAEADIDAHGRAANRLHHPLHLWWAAVAAAGVKLRAGKMTEGEALAEKALAQGLSLQGPHAVAAFMVQRLTYAWEKEGDARRSAMTELRQMAAKFIEQGLFMLPFLVTQLVTDLEIGSPSAGSEVFENIVDEEIAKSVRDQNLIPSIAILARPARELGDLQRARVLYDHLIPHVGRHVVVANVAGYWGPVSFYLGMLATTMSLPEKAADHFEKSVREASAARAPNWKAWSEFELAGVLREHSSRDDGNRSAKLLRSAATAAARFELPRLLALATAAQEQRRDSALRPARPIGRAS